MRLTSGTVRWLRSSRLLLASCCMRSPTVPCVGCSAFDRLKEVRQLEYELDFAQNRAARDKAALKERLAAALTASQKLQVRDAAQCRLE